MEMSSISSSISSAILPFCSDRCSDLLKVCGLFVKLRLQKIIFFSIFLQKSKHLQVLNQFLNHYLSQFNSLYMRERASPWALEVILIIIICKKHQMSLSTWKKSLYPHEKFITGYFQNAFYIFMFMDINIIILII